MLNALIAASLRKPWLVLLLAGLLVVVSVRELWRMPVEVFPELSAPTVTIMTEAPGYAAEEVETAVTFPVETAINGLPGLRRVRSSSTLSLSIVWAEFEFGADVYRNRQLVAERLATVKSQLPANVHEPEMTPVASIAGEILLIALTSSDGSVGPLELRRIAEFGMRPRLLAVRGVAQVTALGGELPEYQILVREQDLLRHELTLADVEHATREAHAAGGGGYLPDVRGRELPIRPLTQVGSVEDIESTVVGTWRGVPVTLDQVADVVLGAAPPRGTGSTGGEPAVVLTVQRNPDANTLELTERIDRVLDDFARTLPDGVALQRDVFRQADFIDVAIANVVHAVRDGFFFVVVILVLFLLNVRTTFIALVALPLSLGAALLVLQAFGATVNVMTLGGIAVAIGSLVDDAIVDMENVYRRLRENAARPPDERKPPRRVVYEASVEVRPAIFLATTIIVLVFAPLFFLSGIEGRLFRPLGLAYVVSLGASLVVAMTVTPVLCYGLLARGRMSERAREGWLVRTLMRGYTSWLSAALRARALTLGAAAALVVLAGLLGSTFGSSFLPDFNEGSLTVNLNTPVGTSLAESDRVARRVELGVGKIEGVASVTRRTGRAEKDEHAEPVSASDLEVRLEPGVVVADIQPALRELLAATPGVTAQVGGPISHRLSHILSGTPAAIAIKIYADDLAVLRQLAKEIEVALRPMPGVTDLVANRDALARTLPVAFDREKLARYGLTPGEVAEQIETAFLGRTVGVVSRGSTRVDIVLRLPAADRRDPADVEAFLLRSPSGALVRVASVAKVREESSPALITRENVKRKAVVSCNVGPGHNLGDLVAAIRERVDPIVARQVGAYVEYGGQFEAREEATARIFWVSLAVLVVIVGLLYASFGSLRPVLLILLNLPLALVGGVVALFLADSPNVFANAAALFGAGSYTAPVVSISALVGFIGLGGVACRNGLLLLSHYQHLMTVEGASLEEATLRGSRERLIPILMTALSSGLALVPLVLAGQEIGSELQYPVAVVILGGLASSTLLNLFVIPVAFASFGRPAKRP